MQLCENRTMSTMASEIFRDWIRTGLRQPGKTQIGLAQHLGIAHPQITQLLNGKRQLKVDEVPKIAEYLERDPPAFPGVAGAGNSPGPTAEAQLRSALLAFGVDREDLSRAVSAVRVFVDYPDEQSSQSLPDGQSSPANPRRVSEPSR